MKNDEILNDLENALTHDFLELGGLTLSKMTDAKNNATAKLNKLLEKNLPETQLQDEIFDACMNISGVYEQEAFNVGFKLGAQIMTEILE